MVPCEETNLLVPVIPPTMPDPPPPTTPAAVAKFDTLFNEVNCLLPNVGAGRGILLSRPPPPTPVVALPSAFSAEVAWIESYHKSFPSKQLYDLSNNTAGHIDDVII
jgi:hypothetical protein